MSEEAKRFRQRAEECRAIAATTLAAEPKRVLQDLADELDLEADKIDAVGAKAIDSSERA